MSEIDDLRKQVDDLKDLVVRLTTEVKALRRSMVKQSKISNNQDVALKRLHTQIERHKVESAAVKKALASISTRTSRWR